LSKRAYFSIFVVTFSMAAFFMAWRDQFERAEGLQAKLSQKPSQPSITINVPPPTVIIQGPAEAKKEVEGKIAPKTGRRKKKEEKSETTEASKLTPPLVQEERHAAPLPPQPLTATVRLASQKTIVSTDPEFPYALEAVLQTDNAIEPVAFAIVCTGAVGKGNAGFPGGGAYIQTKSGQINNDSKMWGFEWKYPAFTSDAPIVVTLYSKEYIQVIGIQQIRYVWP
jgi:hypothetical protein